MIKKRGERERESEGSRRNTLRDNDWEFSQTDEIHQPTDSKSSQDSKQNKTKTTSRHLIAKLWQLKAMIKALRDIVFNSHFTNEKTSLEKLTTVSSMWSNRLRHCSVLPYDGDCISNPKSNRHWRPKILMLDLWLSE